MKRIRNGPMRSTAAHRFPPGADRCPTAAGVDRGANSALRSPWSSSPTSLGPDGQGPTRNAAVRSAAGGATGVRARHRIPGGRTAARCRGAHLRTDTHLSLAGNAALARVVLNVLEPLVRRHRRRAARTSAEVTSGAGSLHRSSRSCRRPRGTWGPRSVSTTGRRPLRPESTSGQSGSCTTPPRRTRARSSCSATHTRSQMSTIKGSRGSLPSTSARSISCGRRLAGTASTPPGWGLR